MKSRLLHISLLILTLAIEARADNLGYSKHNPLIFGIDMNYQPLQYVDDKGTPQGVDIEFTQILMERLNIPYTYAPNSWQEIPKDVLSGRVDLAMMVYSPYRQDSTNYSRAVFRLYYQLLYRKNDNKRDFGLRDVKGKNFAFMSSRPLVDTLTKAGAKIHIVNDLNKAVVGLSKGEYDGVICFRLHTDHLLRANKLSNIEAEDLTLTPREYCYVSNDKALIDSINKELDILEREGVLDDIYGDVKTFFGGWKIPSWVWYVMGALFVVGFLGIIVLQLRYRKRILAEMARAKHNEERALKSERLKTIFLSNISHSLRTPLNAIIGFSELMESEDLSREEQRTLLGLINKNGLQLLHRINELLSLGDIEGKQQLFDQRVTDVDYEMSQYAAEIQMQLTDKVTLDVVEPLSGIRALLDANLLRKVTMHLLENAMQYTKEGKIILSYYVKQGGLYVEVKDTGSGLPENLKENVFALFYDQNTSVQEEIPGLGLSICKAIIDRAGGSIGAKDNTEDGHGTIVWFWIPKEILPN